MAESYPMVRMDYERDVLGEPYEAATLVLPDDDEGEVVATLVRRLGPPGLGYPLPGGIPGTLPAGARRSRKAVLYVHGFVDYFFQTHLATFYTERGFDFYALDLRKYGRSLRKHQTPNFARSLAEYAEELDEAVRIIREEDGHDVLLVNGHSTGGLITALWAHHRAERGLVDGLFLNSPFLALRPPTLPVTLTARAVGLLGTSQPHRVVRAAASGLYVESLHRDLRGEWDFDLRWKPPGGFPVHAGWLAAVLRGHRRVQQGLAIDCPVLVMSSAQSCHPRTWDPILQQCDVVLDADLIAELAPKLGRHTTCVRIKDGLHDLVLSAAKVREQVFAELERWMAAYLPM